MFSFGRFAFHRTSLDSQETAPVNKCKNTPSAGKLTSRANRGNLLPEKVTQMLINIKKTGKRHARYFKNRNIDMPLSIAKSGRFPWALPRPRKAST